MRLFAVVCCLWRTITCGMLAIKPSNKPLHLTAARSPARRPSRLARRGLRPLRSRHTGARGQVSGNGVRWTEITRLVCCAGAEREDVAFHTAAGIETHCERNDKTARQVAASGSSYTRRRTASARHNAITRIAAHNASGH
jgi:hypothetical protein